MREKRKIVSFDQMMWIYLAETYYGHNASRSARYKPVLDKIFESVESQSLIFPISIFTIVEATTHRNSNHRKMFAEFVAKISNGWVFLPPWKIVPQELEKLVSGEENMEIQFIRKPSSENDIVSLFASGEKGFDFSIYNEKISSYASKIEQARRNKIGKAYTRKALRYYYARNMVIDLQNELLTLSQKYEKSADELVEMIGLFENIPVLDVQLDLIIERDRNLDKPVEKNDMVDVSFMSVAIPYTGVVVAEKHWVNLANRTHLDRKYNVSVLQDLAELEDVL